MDHLLEIVDKVVLKVDFLKEPIARGNFQSLVSQAW